MNCPRCNTPAGGSDRTGRAKPNHMCRHDQFDQPPIGYAEIDPERVAAVNKIKADLREIAERGRLGRIAVEEKEAADREAEDRRQERMRADMREFRKQRGEQ